MLEFEGSKGFLADLEVTAKNNHHPKKQTLDNEMQYANKHMVAAEETTVKNNHDPQEQG